MVDQKITDGLNALDADAVDLAKSKGDADAAVTELGQTKAAAEAAVAGSQHKVDTTKSDVAARTDKLKADRDALVQLIQSSYPD